MKVVVVGCGTVVPEPSRGSSCYFLEHGATRALLDCGPGAVQGMARLGIPWDELTHLFITHFHADHIGALPGLFFAFRHGILPPRTAEQLEVIGPVGTTALFRNLAAAFGEYLLEPGFPMAIREIPPGGEIRTGDLRVAAKDVPHTPESVALRFEPVGESETSGSLVYTGDTGPDEELAAFSKDAHLLLAECSLPDDLVGDNHLSPSRLARLALRANARRVVATHVYPQFRQATDVAALVRSAGYAGPVELAREGLEIRF